MNGFREKLRTNGRTNERTDGRTNGCESIGPTSKVGGSKNGSSCKFIHKNMPPCRNMHQCRKKNCRFDHNEAAGRSRPENPRVNENQQNQSLLQRNEQINQKICMYFNKTTGCTNRNCTFVHKQMPACRYGKDCRRRNCRFDHKDQQQTNNEQRQNNGTQYYQQQWLANNTSNPGNSPAQPEQQNEGAPSFLRARADYRPPDPNPQMEKQSMMDLERMIKKQIEIEMARRFQNHPSSNINQQRYMPTSTAVPVTTPHMLNQINKPKSTNTWTDKRHLNLGQPVMNVPLTDQNLQQQMYPTHSTFPTQQGHMPILGNQYPLPTSGYQHHIQKTEFLPSNRMN